MTDANVKSSGDNCDTSLGLLDRLSRRDEVAWRRFVSLYTPLVVHWLGGFGLQAADLDDLTQEVFNAVGRNIDRFRRDQHKGSFRGWLRTIARNKARDLIRSAKRLPTPAEGGSDAQQKLAEIRDDAVDPSTEECDARGIDQERGILYERALALLKADFQEPTWRAFWQVVVEDRSVEETAIELNISVNSVYLAKSRVLRRLREELLSLID